MSEGGFTGELPGPVQEAAPPRKPGSIRRTSHLDMIRRPDSFGLASITGAARDLVTTEDGAVELGTAWLRVGVDENGLVDSVVQDPEVPSCAALAGLRPGFGFRSGAKELLGELDGSLLGLLVDDLSGAPAPAGYGAIRERRHKGETDVFRTAAAAAPGAPAAARVDMRVDVCAGWRAQGIPVRRRTEGRERVHDEPPVAPSLVSDDPLAWHELPELGPRGTRRIRRLDLVVDGDDLLADVMFRDGLVDLDGTPRVVHEYAVTATIDRQTLTIKQIHADPRALPYVSDCPLAAESTRFLLGETVPQLRRRVKEISRGADSCTHLNDLYRSMADIGLLADALTGTSV